MTSPPDGETHPVTSSTLTHTFLLHFKPYVTKAKRTCGNKAEWSHVIDLSECVSKEIVELQDKLDSLTRNFSLILVRELMDGLEEKVSTGDDLYGGDLEPLAKIMVAAVNLTQSKGVMNVSDVDRILESVVNTTSILLQPKNIDTWMDLPRTKQSSTATRLLWAVESSSAFRANSISETRNFKVTAPGLDVIVDDLMQTNFSASFNWIGTHDTVDYLKPRMPEAGNGLGHVTLALFDGVGQWLHVNESATKYPELNATSSAVNDSFSEDTPEATSVLVVNTRVMSISIVSRSGIDVEKVRYIMEHKEKKSSDSDPVCVFWKYSKETFEGHWSDEGCRDVTNCPYCTYTVCECDHLTNFAVLMSVSSHQNLMSLGHAFALSGITYIGCIISIVCLALAFITFYWFKDLQCVRNTIHKNLVLCLFISEVIFLPGIVQYEHKEQCAAVAAFLHYFFLASFSWMFLEGVQLYVLLIEVFEARTFRLRWYYISGYG